MDTSSTLAQPLPFAGPAQWAPALEKANRIRLARAELKRQIARQPTRSDSFQLAASLLDTPPTVLAAMPVCELVCACRRVQHKTARRLLARVPVSERRPIGELTGRQRTALAQLLRSLSS